VSTEGAQVRTARARKEEQRRQHLEARFNRVCSAFAHVVLGFVCRNLNAHMGLQVEESGQLPDLGSLEPFGSRTSGPRVPRMAMARSCHAI
jgi:hypothetical protein